MQIPPQYGSNASDHISQNSKRKALSIRENDRQVNDIKTKLSIADANRPY